MDNLVELKTLDFELLIWAKGVSYSEARYQSTVLARGGSTESSALRFFPGILVKREAELEKISTYRIKDIEGNGHAVFFENKNYDIELIFDKHLDFKTPEKYPVAKHALTKIEDLFHFNPRTNSLRAIINTRNDVGRFEFFVEYRKDKALIKQTISFDVLPTKMDLASDLQAVNSLVDEQYPLWRYSLAESTSHGLKHSKLPKPEFLLMWLARFEVLVNDLNKATKQIINAPHNRLIKVNFKRPIQKFKGNRISQRQQEKIRGLIADNQLDRKLTISRKNLTIDTLENRFIKHVLSKSVAKLGLIKTGAQNKDINKPRISNNYYEQLEAWQKPLRSYLNQPFFKEVGKFEGLSKESLVLQQKPGYAKVYRIWQELKWHLEFLGDDSFLSQKNVAEMYEIWCFLQIRLLIFQMGFEETSSARGQYKIEKSELESNDPLVGGFKFKRESDGVKITLAHEPLFNETKKPIRIWTVSQRPDIVMEVDIPDGGSFVWVFDAKYRIENKDDTRGGSSDKDLAPDDAINQMHRYRDALIHSAEDLPYGSVRKSRPVYGAYVLYPGFYDQLDVTIENPYQEAINEIGIGAFSLLPSENGRGSRWLKEFLHNKVNGDAQIDGRTSSDKYFVEESARIPYRGTSVSRYKDLTILFSGVVEGRSDVYTQKLNDDQLPFYHTQLLATKRQQIEAHIINEVRFLGIADLTGSDSQRINGLYPVLSVKMLKRKDISAEITGAVNDSNSEAIYWLFELGTAAVLQAPIDIETPRHFTVSLVGYEKALRGGDIRHIPTLYSSVLIET